MGYDENFEKTAILLGEGDFVKEEVLIAPKNIAYIRAASREEGHPEPSTAPPAIRLIKPVTNTFYRTRETSELLSKVMLNRYNISNNIYDTRIDLNTS